MLHRNFAWIKSLYHFIAHTTSSFFTDDCYSKASSLAFYSLLSIVPVLAVLFGIAQGFGFEKALQTEISKNIFQQPEINDKLTEFASSWLNSVKGGVIAGVGTIFLLWSVISLFNNVESTLNEIWMVQKSRSYSHKVRDYLTIFFVAPLFFVTASSINIYLTTELTETAHNYEFVQAISPIILFLLNLFPFFLIWILFTFIYAFIPNTKVNFVDALIAGLIAGTAFQIWQWVYINFQVRLSTYGVIYGSFAALPLFLIWLQSSWLIVLAGAEIAAGLKNGFFQNRQEQSISEKSLGLLVVYLCAKAFVEGKSPPTDQELEQKLGMTPRHLYIILDALCQNRILSEVNVADKAVGYQPAHPIEYITLQMIYNALDQSHHFPAYIEDNIDLQNVENLMNNLQQTIHNSPENQSLDSLVKST